MTYSAQIRHPSGALDPLSGKQRAVPWRLLVAAGIVALVLIAIFRPQWLARVGIVVQGLATKVPGVVLNPHGWV